MQRMSMEGLLVQVWRIFSFRQHSASTAVFLVASFCGSQPLLGPDIDSTAACFFVVLPRDMARLNVARIVALGILERSKRTGAHFTAVGPNELWEKTVRTS
jgi:hypothetical protein